MQSHSLLGRTCAASLVALALTLTGQASATTFYEALRIAEREAPSLQALKDNVAAARSMAIPAAALPDPKLNLGLQSLPIEGDNRWRLEEDGMTSQRVGISQQVPNRDKRHARAAAAQAGADLAGAKLRVEQLQVQLETAAAWIQAKVIGEQLAAFPALYRENRLFAKAVTAAIAGGKASTADSVQPKQEAALLAEREDELIRASTAARAALRRWIGDAAERPLSGDWPAWSTSISQLKSGLPSHPALTAMEPRYRQASAVASEAIAAKKPDWTWSVDYQHRGDAFGDMISLNLSVDLPIFAATRQDPVIAARQAQVTQVDAERQALLRELSASLDADLAELQRAERALARLDDTFLPLAEEKVRLSTADYSAGRGSLSAVVSARQTLIETRLRRIEVHGQRALVLARLNLSFGASDR
jgi:outer membrane protein TolC